jgi:hypothetical protein
VVPEDPCKQCGHAVDAHEVISTSADASDGGIILCSVVGCECYATWSLNGGPATRVLNRIEVEVIREGIRRQPHPEPSRRAARSFDGRGAAGEVSPEWIGRSRLRISVFMLVGLCLIAGAIVQAHRVHDRVAYLIASGRQVQATVTGAGRDSDSLEYTIDGHVVNVSVHSAWAPPPYDRGEIVAAYVSPSDPSVVATQDGATNAGIFANSPLVMVIIGGLLVFLAGLGMLFRRATARRSPSGSRPPRSGGQVESSPAGPPMGS